MDMRLNCHWRWLMELSEELSRAGRISWSNTARQAAGEIELLQTHRDKLLSWRLASLETLQEIAGVQVPLESLELNHRMAVEAARELLASTTYGSDSK